MARDVNVSIVGRLGRHRGVAAQACRSFKAMVGAAMAEQSMHSERERPGAGALSSGEPRSHAAA